MAGSILRAALCLTLALLMVPADGQTQPAVRIGILNTDVSAEPLYAQAFGYFKRAGIDAQVRSFRDAAAPLADVKAGRLEIGFTNSASAADEIQHGAPLVILAPAAMYVKSAPITVLVEAPASNFRSGKDLNGKTISVPAARDLGTVITQAWVDQHGGDSATLHYVHSIPMAEVASALAQHVVDVAEISEPAWTVATRAHRVKVVADTMESVGGPFAIGVFVADASWVRAHPAAARAFARAMTAAAPWANAHRAQTAPILAQRMHVPVALVLSMHRATYPAALTPALLDNALAASARYHLIAPVKAVNLLHAAQ